MNASDRRGQGDMCPGSGRRWGSGTGAPICPVCHLGPRGLGVTPPVRRRGRWTGNAPQHRRRTA